jgi:hypothetical protein
MIVMNSNELFNQPRHTIGNFLWLAVVFLFVGLTALGILAAGSGRRAESVKDGWETVLALVIVLFLLGTLTMLLSALVTLPAARRAAREIQRFREGGSLVHWVYSPELWSWFIRDETRRIRRVGRGMGFGIFAFTALVGEIIAWATPGNTESKILWSMAALGIAAGMGSAIGGIYFTYAARRGRRLQADGQSFVSATAAYCGGDFAYWQHSLWGLRRIELIPAGTGEGPAFLELTLGYSPSTKTFVGGLDMLMLLIGRPICISSMTVQRRIPVPPGQEGVAGELAELLLKSQRSSDPKRPHHRGLSTGAFMSMRWRIPLILSGCGMSLFIASVVASIVRGPQYSLPPAWAAVATAGAALVAIAIVAAIIAGIITLIRSATVSTEPAETNQSDSKSRLDHPQGQSD